MPAKSYLVSIAVAASVILAAGPAAADPNKDENGECKFESDEGNCKVEEKSGRDSHKKEVKCDHGGPG